MLKSILKASFLVFVLLTAAFPAFADEVFLTNGRQMTGLVSEETADSVTLDVGIGTVTLRRSEILWIEKTPEEIKENIQDSWDAKRIEDDLRKPTAYRTRVPLGKSK
jgi:hypothetical protein